MKTSVAELTVVGFLLGVQSSLVVYGALLHSPTWDEPSHLSAGISQWRYAEFRSDMVNPPLQRMLAALPAIAMGCAVEGPPIAYGPYFRPEHSMATTFLQGNKDNAFRLIAWGRLVCVPFGVLGGIICWLWARSLYGKHAGIAALCLWSFCPNVLAYSQLCTPDIAATSCGLLANYLFGRWLRNPVWARIPLLGVTFGVAQLTKFTWIILFVLWPLIWLIQFPWRTSRNPSAQVWQLFVCIWIGVFTIDCGYEFSGVFTKLGDFEFVSSLLSGEDVQAGPGNRFRATFLEYLPMPFPREYIAGIDMQKYDFDRGIQSYLRGCWSDRGWWYFYLYGLAIKEPLGTWMIALLAAGLTAVHFRRTAKPPVETVLLLQGMAIVILVSSQTGFSHHFRYVLPCLPFFYIWASKVFEHIQLRLRSITAIGTVFLVWAIESSIWIYPHTLSYFNELVGGPTNGHSYMLFSNVDWGQDLFLLKKWYDQHGYARPFHLAYDLPHINPELAGIQWRPVPRGPAISCSHGSAPDEARVTRSAIGAVNTIYSSGPSPGWHALSVNQIHRPDGIYNYFLLFKPITTVGYSMRIYHITPESANRIRHTLGMSALPESWNEETIEGSHD